MEETRPINDERIYRLIDDKKFYESSQKYEHKDEDFGVQREDFIRDLEAIFV